MSSQGLTARHRLMRKYAYQQLGTKALVAAYSTLQEAAVGRFLWRIHHSKGEGLDGHLKTLVS